MASEASEAATLFGQLDIRFGLGDQVRHLRPGSALASGFPRPRQDFQVHFGVQVRHLRPGSALASGFPGPRQDFQVHFGVQVRHLRPGSALASGFPDPRQDVQVHFRISRSTSGFPVPRQDFQVYFGRPGPRWPTRFTLADCVCPLTFHDHNSTNTTISCGSNLQSS